MFFVVLCRVVSCRVVCRGAALERLEPLVQHTVQAARAGEIGAQGTCQRNALCVRGCARRACVHAVQPLTPSLKRYLRHKYFILPGGRSPASPRNVPIGRWEGKGCRPCLHLPPVNGKNGRAAADLSRTSLDLALNPSINQSISTGEACVY